MESPRFSYIFRVLLVLKFLINKLWEKNLGMIRLPGLCPDRIQGLWVYPSAAGPICLPAYSLNQHVILRKEIKMGYFAGGISLVAVLEREKKKIKTRSKGIVVRWFLIGGLIPPSQENELYQLWNVHPSLLLFKSFLFSLSRVFPHLLGNMMKLG